MTLSERILADNAAVFDAMVSHRFVRDIEADRLPPAVFDRYLAYESAFVEWAIAIFAHAVAKAPGIAEQRWLIGVLDALANRQVAYFEATFAARGIDPAAFDLGRPEVAAFREGMLSIAEGGYLDIVAAMFTAEWMYWTWCRRAAATPATDPHQKEWVALHAAEDFAAQALGLPGRSTQPTRHSTMRHGAACRRSSIACSISRSRLTNRPIKVAQRMPRCPLTIADMAPPALEGSIPNTGPPGGSSPMMCRLH